MTRIYWIADGCGSKVNDDAAKVMIKWVRRQADAALIVYGGDIYGSGTSREFNKFLDQFSGQVREVCALPGNHDWRTSKRVTGAGEIADGYETFWSAVPAPGRTVIRTGETGSARYDYFNDDVPGWRLIFVDTSAAGDDEGNWPRGITSRVTWLADTLRATPGRSKILFTHHSRLSCGNHGDQPDLQKLWENLFEGAGERPLVSLTLGGHDHNVSVYAPRGKQPSQIKTPADGISIVVNGAGGRNHNDPDSGTPPDKSDVNNFCLTRITFLDQRSADVEFLSFGTGSVTEPALLEGMTVRIRN